MKRKLKLSSDSYCLEKGLSRAVFFAGCLALSSCQVLSSAESIEQTVAPESNKKLVAETGSKVTFDGLRAKDPQAKLGAAEHPKILATYGGAYENSGLETLLALIVGRLVAQSNDSGRAYEITVLNSPTVNAFALPGGYLYVTRGLLALANDESEVAAVLAHEMAHVSSNHGVLRSRQAKVVDIADRVVSEVVSNPLVGKVVKASTEQRLVKFSQRQELQADAVGIKTLGKAGFDPYGSSRFLISMDRYSSWRSKLSSGGEDMSSSHPSTPRRIELARRHARLVGPPGTGVKKRVRFLQGIKGIKFGDTAKEGFIRGQQFSHLKLGISFRVPSGFELSNKADSVLAAGPNEMALRFDGVNSKGQLASPVGYMKSGWVNGLDASTVKARNINGMKAAVGRAYAGNWQFSISVVRNKGRYYRFILAAPRSNQGVVAIGDVIASSFKNLTQAEKSRIKPLVINVVKVKQGDTIASMSARMKGVSSKTELFRTINALGVGRRLKLGQSVKLISEG